MLSRLKLLVEEVATLQSKLVLLIGLPGCGKTALLFGLAEQTSTPVLNLNLELGSRLARLPHRGRQLQAGSLLREIADEHAGGDLLLIDNIELLFDASLALNPLDLMKRLAHARRVVVAWPGEHRQGVSGPRLHYAETGHPEHRDYALDGVVPFYIQA